MQVTVSTRSMCHTLILGILDGSPHAVWNSIWRLSIPYTKVIALQRVAHHEMHRGERANSSRLQLKPGSPVSAQGIVVTLCDPAVCHAFQHISKHIE